MHILLIAVQTLARMAIYFPSIHMTPSGMFVHENRTVSTNQRTGEFWTLRRGGVSDVPPAVDTLPLWYLQNCRRVLALSRQVASRLPTGQVLWCLPTPVLVIHQPAVASSLHRYDIAHVSQRPRPRTPASHHSISIGQLPATTDQ